MADERRKRYELGSKRGEEGKNVEAADEAKETEKSEKKRRGRPNKAEKISIKEAEGMQNYLEKGKIIRYELRFGNNRKVMHSPRKEQRDTVGKEETFCSDREDTAEVIKDAERHNETCDKPRNAGDNENRTNTKGKESDEEKDGEGQINSINKDWETQ